MEAGDKAPSSWEDESRAVGGHLSPMARTLYRQRPAEVYGKQRVLRKYIGSLVQGFLLPAVFLGSSKIKLVYT